MFAQARRSGVLLAGLEHLDDRYLKAVGYTTKSKRGAQAQPGSTITVPKMVLFGDIAGDDADAVAQATSEVVRIANSRNGEGLWPSALKRAKNSGSIASARQRFPNIPTPSKSTRMW
jgi:FAD/FMN-containing dehydrogenase